MIFYGFVILTVYLQLIFYEVKMSIKLYGNIVDEQFRSITPVSNSWFYPFCIPASFDNCFLVMVGKWQRHLDKGGVQ